MEAKHIAQKQQTRVPIRGGRRPRHPFELKLEVVRLYLEDFSARLVCQETGIGKNPSRFG